MRSVSTHSPRFNRRTSRIASGRGGRGLKAASGTNGGPPRVPAKYPALDQRQKASRMGGVKAALLAFQHRISAAWSAMGRPGGTA